MQREEDPRKKTSTQPKKHTLREQTVSTGILTSQVEQESERIGKDAMECQIIADDAEADLAVAMPALEKAMAEVDKLDKTSITEARFP